jgi:hypothetical protein
MQLLHIKYLQNNIQVKLHYLQYYSLFTNQNLLVNFAKTITHVKKV